MTPTLRASAWMFSNDSLIRKGSDSPVIRARGDKSGSHDRGAKRCPIHACPANPQRASRFVEHLFSTFPEKPEMLHKPLLKRGGQPVFSNGQANMAWLMFDGWMVDPL